MTRFPIAVLCSAAIGVAFVHARQEPTFHSGTHTVSVYTTVLDTAGRLVTDLKKGDFEILDNGVPQELTVFASDLQPITVVVMLDRSRSMEKNFGLMREGAQQFLDNLLRADKARLGSFSDRIQIDPARFTSDHDELASILRDKMQPPGITPLWNATDAAMTALAREDGRRVVLVFTDGFNAPDWNPSNVSFAKLRNRSQAEGVMVYAIGLADKCSPASTGPYSYPGQPRYEQRPRGPFGRFPIPRGPIGSPPGGPIGTPPRPPGGPPTIDPPFGTGEPLGKSKDAGEDDLNRTRPCYDSRPDPDLRELAAVSGGGYFELTDTNDLRSTFARVADELHHQYLLAFAPTILDGQTHVLEVKLRRPGATVRARQSYVATPDK